MDLTLKITIAVSLLFMAGTAFSQIKDVPGFGKGDLARSLNPETITRLTRVFKGLGYRFITLDLEGYRTGSLNEVLLTRVT